jgi:hypothetical protein
MAEAHQTDLRAELRVLHSARTRLEAARKRKPPARRNGSRVDKLVGLLATQPLRHWYIEELVEGLPGIPGGRARVQDRERAVRATIGQTQQRGLIENTGRRRYRLTAAGRAMGTGRGPGATSSNGAASPHVGHAIAALKKEERAVSDELRRVERSMSSARGSSGRAMSKRVQPGEHGTQLDQLVSVMVVRPDDEWSIDDMLQALVAKGWKTSSAYPEQIVRNNITHALTLGLVRRVGRGRYRIRPQAHKAAATRTATKPTSKRTPKRAAARSTSSGRTRARAGTMTQRRPGRRRTATRRGARRTAKR